MSDDNKIPPPDPFQPDPKLLDKVTKSEDLLDPLRPDPQLEDKSTRVGTPTTRNVPNFLPPEPERKPE